MESKEHETPTKEKAQQTRLAQLTELAVFLFLIVPSAILSLFVVRQGSLSFTIVAVSTILRDIGLVALIVLFVSRDNETIRQIGWTFRNGWWDVLLGIALFVPFILAVGLLESAFRAAGLSAPPTSRPPFLTAQGYGEFALGFLLVVVVAAAEETIFRGYLILRLRNLVRSSLVAVLASAAVFSLGHGYEGSAGVATVGLIGVGLGLIYLWRKSLVAPIVIHFLMDFLSIVLLPLLGVS